MRVLLGLFLLLLAAAVVTIWLGPPGPRIVCHRGLDGAFQQWTIETTNGNRYPNIEGSSAKTLALVASHYYGPDPSALDDYRYVPGLNHDDPKDLILAYVKEPCRRTWHGDCHWFRPEKRWLILNPQMDYGGNGPWGELSEWIATYEFEQRLAKTLQFLRENQRTNWASVVQEHQKLLSQLQSNHNFAQR